MTRLYIKRAPKILADALETRRENVINIESANFTNQDLAFPLPTLQIYSGVATFGAMHTLRVYR